MSKPRSTGQARVNYARYQPRSRSGFYESFFQRANHPTRSLAFWIRYTLFSPAGRPEAALGELWAIFFDGETGRHAVAKSETPFSHGCSFDRDAFSVAVGDARLAPGELAGAAGSGDGAIRWSLSYEGGGGRLLLLPEAMYEAPLPRAKSLVGVPMAVYRGSLVVGGREIEVTDWVGSQNHNWGTKHTDLYAWGQVAGFDSHPGSFLEVATARLKIGPLWTPRMTPLVLRHGGEEIALNSLSQIVRAEASFDYFTWRFRTTTERFEVDGRITAGARDVVGLVYKNPPGGEKHCLNTKLAACNITLRRMSRGRAVGVETLSTAHRAAFEILTDDLAHGVPIRA